MRTYELQSLSRLRLLNYPVAQKEKHNYVAEKHNDARKHYNYLIAAEIIINSSFNTNQQTTYIN